jgi:hypothetical protein
LFRFQRQSQDRDFIQLENELLTIRERYNELAEYSNRLKYELENARKQIHERSLLERDTVRIKIERFNFEKKNKFLV